MTSVLLVSVLLITGIHSKLLEAFSLRAPPLVSRATLNLICDVCSIWLLQEQDSLQYNSELVSLLLSILDTATATSEYSGP